MSRYMMKCGHADNAQINLPDGTIKPICAICECMNVEKEINEPTEGLTGRMAICTDHKYGKANEPVNSRWDLPFFEYRPNCEYDSYYCGCYGWD